MNVFPELEEIKRLASDGQYLVAPVCTEIFSDICTPIEALRILKNVSDHTYLLESLEEKDRWGRFTFLGYDPVLDITCIDGKIRTMEKEFESDDPTAFLRELLKDYYGRNGFAYAYRIPGMNKVLQAGGRVIRTMQDRGWILLLDERFTHPEYRSCFPPSWDDRMLCTRRDIAVKIRDFWDSAGNQA